MRSDYLFDSIEETGRNVDALPPDWSRSTAAGARQAIIAGRDHFVDRLGADRTTVGRDLFGIASWPPLAMLLAIWHDLSDVRLADALADRALLSPVLRLCSYRTHAGTHSLCPLSPRASASRP